MELYMKSFIRSVTAILLSALVVPFVGCNDPSDGYPSNDEWRYLLCYEEHPQFVEMWCLFTWENRCDLFNEIGPNAQIYSEYDTNSECEDAWDDISTQWKRGGVNPPGLGGNPGGGTNPGSGPVDCEQRCLPEIGEVQVDSFCQVACCHSISGFPDRAQATCEAGAALGSNRCQYCQ